MAWKKPEKFINSLTFSHFINTIELDLSGIYGKGQYPTKHEVNTFIVGEMQCTAEMLRGTQHHPRVQKVHVQFETEQQVQQVELRVREGLLMLSKGFKIFGTRCDSPMVTIILNGQDMSIEKAEITRILARYGTVVTCERGKNYDLSTEEKDINDGTWVIRMTPKPRSKPPATIYYVGAGNRVETWILSYDGVVSNCFQCGALGHPGFRCNATVARSGIGPAPEGLGKWTDIRTYQSGVVAQPVAQPVAGPVQGGGTGGGYRERYHERLPASQDINRVRNIDNRAKDTAWGAVAVQAPEEAPVQVPVKGPAEVPAQHSQEDRGGDLDQHDERGFTVQGKEKRNRKNRNNKNRKNGNKDLNTNEKN